MTIICFTGNSQEEATKTIFKSVEINQTETVILEFNSNERNVIGELKDDLISFDEKVTMVILDEEEQLLYVTYNDKMLLEDLINTFRKHNVNYLKESKFKGATTKHEQL